MGEKPTTDVCPMCDRDVPEDPPSITVPSPVRPRLSPLASPGVEELAFCCERHLRDWKDKNRGDWSEEE